MASRFDDRAWELVGAVAAIEPSAVPEEAMRILLELRGRAGALLAARGGYLAVGHGARAPHFGLSPAVAHREPAEELDWDIPPDVPIPRD